MYIIATTVYIVCVLLLDGFDAGLECRLHGPFQLRQRALGGVVHVEPEGFLAPLPAALDLTVKVRRAVPVKGISKKVLNNGVQHV